MTETISEKGGEIAMTTAQKIKKEGIKEGIKTTAKNLCICQAKSVPIFN